MQQAAVRTDNNPEGEARIFLKNDSGEDRSYFIFLEAPKVSGGDQQVFQSVYTYGHRGSLIRSGSGTPFFCNPKIFAVTGVTRRRLGLDVKLEVSDCQEVRLCDGSWLGSLHRIITGRPNEVSFVRDPSPGCTEQGAFSIECGDLELGAGVHAFVGLGVRAPNDPDIVIPVATFAAMPGVVNIIEPQRPKRYYISWGDYVPGQVIDVDALHKPYFLDFAGRPSMTALLVHCEDGYWRSKYLQHDHRR